MQEKLPRELRDKIYEYTVGLTSSHMGKYRYGDAEVKWKPWTKPNTSFGWLRDLDDCGVLHIRNIEFVGIDTLREIAETYYRTVIFVFEDWYGGETVAPLYPVTIFGGSILLSQTTGTTNSPTHLNGRDNCLMHHFRSHSMGIGMIGFRRASCL
jgi:hypothetical protein